MAVIENVGVCRLGGFENSNPEILAAYPPLNKTIPDAHLNEFINKSLPVGTIPGAFSLNKIKDVYILSYTFKIQSKKEGIRDDLASISVVISDKKVNIDHFENLFKEIIIKFNGNLERLTRTVLKKLLEKIYNGVNDNKKIKLENVTIDVPDIIKKKKLNIRKKELKEFKGAF
ncbi:MAG: hypothetical protein ACTSUE_18365 [Promethearchaeota archaeon]